MSRPVPTLLLILDGWGIAPDGPGNAPFTAATPRLDALTAACPHSRLAASGREVGLPAGYMGNSEVGHLNIGAGRIVYQDMTRIDVALEDGSFFQNAVLRGLLDAVAGVDDAGAAAVALAQIVAPLAAAEWTRHREDVLWDPEEAKKRAKEEDERKSKEALAAKFAHVKDDSNKETVEL